MPYPYTLVTLEHAEHFHLMKYELLGQITHVTDHKWSELVSNFAKHERNAISGEMVAHKVDIPIPVKSYIRVDRVSERQP